MSNLYCKTKSGKIFKVWSDNVDEKTMNVFPYDEQFDAESTNTDIIPYADIDTANSDLSALEP